MNLLDIILGIILIYSFFQGTKKGLFVTLASLIGLVLGIIGAVYFSDYAANYINEWFSWKEQTTSVVAMAVTFIAIVIIVNWAGKFLTKIVDFAFLGIFNKLLGGVFNMIISAFIVSVIFMFFNEWNATEYVISEEKKNNSYLYEPIANLAPLILPDLIEEIENIDIPKDILDINKSEKKQ
ncbi:MAG: CvpA family protein [Flavobacteriaceae bacterium]|nr:CvpA family protein [Flavobacteriaceae bacterium]|tara:strand:- start:1022 stop:1564 length:543 start_codon:yes stop_codon:yes gene_type:complete